MSSWEPVLGGIAAIAILVFFLPGVRNALKNAPKGSTSEWLGLVRILAFVVLFVVVLIMLVR
jgi:hypothetical protein